MNYKVEYYSGAGNLFSVFDNRTNLFKESQFNELAIVLCSGIDDFTLKTEGLIIIEENSENPFLVKFFNPDGSSGMMCGNGARCAVKYAIDNEIIHLTNYSEFNFELASVNYKAKLENNLIKVFFPKPNYFDLAFPVSSSKSSLNGMIADVGTLHLIFNYADVPNSENFDFDYYPLFDFAPEIRYNQSLFPNGTNVSIFKILNENTVLLRTYEKGVELETGACGTGAIATALLLYKNKNTNSKVKIIPTSKKPLEVELLFDENNEISGFSLMGEAEKIGITSIKI